MLTSRLRGSTALGIVAVMASLEEYDRVSPPTLRSSLHRCLKKL